MDTRPAFLVWNPSAGFPTFAHDSYQSAIKESERLARNNPGQSFHVMAIAGTSVVEVPSVYRENSDYRHIPF